MRPRLGLGWCFFIVGTLLCLPRLHLIAGDISVATLYGHAKGVQSVAITPDGRYIISGSEDESIKVWSLSNTALLTTLTGHSGGVYRVLVTPDGSKMISASGDATIKIWKTQDWSLSQTLSGHTSGVVSGAITPDGTIVASGSLDSSIILWSIADGTRIRTLTGHTDHVLDIAVTYGGSVIVSASKDRAVKVWRLSDGGLVHTITSEGYFYSVAVSLDDSKVITGGLGEIGIWSLSNGTRLEILGGRNAEIRFIRFTPDGSKFFTGGSDNTIKMWNYLDGYMLNTIQGHTGAVSCLDISEDGVMMVSSSFDKTIQLWSLGTGGRSPSRSRTRSRHNPASYSPTRGLRYDTIRLTGKSMSEKMGYQVTVSNGIAVVSVPFCVDQKKCDGGYLLTYMNTNGIWSFHKKIDNPFYKRDIKFGALMVTEGDYLLISAPDSHYINCSAGIVAVYKWEHEASLYVKEMSLRAKGISKDFDFSKSITKHENVIAVGCPKNTVKVNITNAGRVYIFRDSQKTKWNPVPVFIRSPLGQPDEYFGASVSLKSTSILAVSNDPLDNSIRAVYLFQVENLLWTCKQTIKEESRSGFGWYVKFINDNLFVSAVNDSSIVLNAGSLCVYKAYGQGVYMLESVIYSNRISPGEHFGFRLSSTGNKLAVGTNTCGEGSACISQGAVYLLAQQNNLWLHDRNFAYGLPDGSDGFGYDVAIDNNFIIASAPFDSTKGAYKGAVYFINI